MCLWKTRMNFGKSSQHKKQGFGSLNKATWTCCHNEDILFRHMASLSKWSWKYFPKFIVSNFSKIRKILLWTATPPPWFNFVKVSSSFDNKSQSLYQANVKCKAHRDLVGCSMYASIASNSSCESTIAKEVLSPRLSQYARDVEWSLSVLSNVYVEFVSNGLRSVSTKAHES